MKQARRDVAGFASFSKRLLDEEMQRPFGRPEPVRSTQLRIAPPPSDRALGLARREPTEMHCIMCGRPSSTHGQPVEIGDEVIMPVCELIHGRTMIPAGPPDPNVRSRADRHGIANAMSVLVARSIAGNLGKPSKMPGASYGIDAWKCMVGGELADLPGSVCHGCYARKNFYATWWPAMKARHQRQASLRHPRWTEAMIVLCWDHLARGGEPYFRWHDSGDLQSVEHLARIVAVCEMVHDMKFWLPTREYAIVAAFRREGGVFPKNLTVRLSAHFVGRPPEMREADLADLPTSTVHDPAAGPVMVSARRADVVACRAWTRDNQCGKCRACWSGQVRSVSYPMH